MTTNTKTVAFVNLKAEAVRRGTTIRDMLTAWIECDCPPLDAADARAEAKQDGRRSG